MKPRIRMNLHLLECMVEIVVDVLLMLICMSLPDLAYTMEKTNRTTMTTFIPNIGKQF